MLNKISHSSNFDQYSNAASVYESELLSGSGHIKALERKLAKHYGKKFAITFSNATQTIFFICLALDIKENEIITSPFTWGGSIAPFLFFNNKILFSEFDFDNYCLDPQKLNKRISKNTKVLLSIDYCGNPADTKSLKKYCEDNNLLLISDSSQSFGAYYENKPAGFYSDIIIVSFGQGKPLYGGEGGAVITSDEKLLESLIWLSQHPQRQKKHFGLSYLNQFGLNGRINPLAPKQIISNWDKFLKNLKNKQNGLFDFYNYLKNNGVIKAKIFLKEPVNSSFYIPIFEMSPDINPSEVNLVFNKREPYKGINHYKIQLLTEDNFFIKEYSHLSRNLISKQFIRDLNSRNYVCIN